MHHLTPVKTEVACQASRPVGFQALPVASSLWLLSNPSSTERCPKPSYSHFTVLLCSYQKIQASPKLQTSSLELWPTVFRQGPQKVCAGCAPCPLRLMPGSQNVFWHGFPLDFHWLTAICKLTVLVFVWGFCLKYACSFRYCLFLYCYFNR